jgi:hypothetical protein
MGMAAPGFDALRWLATDDARAAAAFEVSARSLPLAMVDDLLGMVAASLAQRFASLEHPDDIAEPVAYARRAIALRAVDLQRGEIRERSFVTAWPSDDDGMPADAATPPTLDAGDDVEVSETVAAMRRSLHALLTGSRPWAAAAALTVLTLARHRDVPIPPEAPVPAVGAEEQRMRWVALYLAGQRACFAIEAGASEDAAMRQRRARAVRAVDDVLTLAASTSGLEVRGG